MTSVRLAEGRERVERVANMELGREEKRYLNPSPCCPCGGDDGAERVAAP